MKRWIKIFTAFISLAVPYLYILATLFRMGSDKFWSEFVRHDVPKALHRPAEEIFPILPYWCLITFGSYSLCSIGWSLFTFGECEEAYRELAKEIEQAKTELSRHGIE